MRRTTYLATIVAMAAMFVGCAGTKEHKPPTEEEIQAAAPEPKMGVVTSVDGERLMIDDTADTTDEPQLFERTTESIVVREGRTVNWNELQEGDTVRVSYDEGIFGPDRAVRIEVVPAEEAMPLEEPGGLEAPEPTIPDEPGVDENGMDTPGELGPRPIEPQDEPMQPTEPDNY